MVGRSLKTGDIEKVIKDGKVYLRLTSSGKEKIHREFPISNFTQKWNKKWIVIIFDIAEKSRKMRDKLRTKVQSIGFGMLQESVWISPLPIGEDIKEMIEQIGLKKNVFVMEVSGLIFGNPMELANKIWNLDGCGEELLSIREKLNKINQLIGNYNDREQKREAKLYKLKEKKRGLMKNYLEILIRFPALPQELLPKSLRSIRFIY
jgi:phenylacetic acid degradation operon negative regulatory protein